MAKIDAPRETVPAEGRLAAIPACAKPLRADARRNREKVIAAARLAFAEHGRDAQMDDVARRAQVGVGTVYRHFPTKEALFVALLEDTFAEIADRTRPALEQEDAWAAFTAMLWDAGETLAGDRALVEAMAADLTDQPCSGQVELTEIAAELMERARTAGDLRPDAVIEDIPMLLCGLGSAAERPHPCGAPWRRHLAILIDGLRARPDSTPLPG
jgi:AcrR family transcriptional regulator